MKNSAWDHKLWSDKLDQLRLTEEAASEWADMKQLLDEQLPQEIAVPSAKPTKINRTNLLFLLAVITFIIIVLSLVYRKKSTPAPHHVPEKNQSSVDINPKKEKETRNRDKQSLDTLSTPINIQKEKISIQKEDEPIKQINQNSFLNKQSRQRQMVITPAETSVADKNASKSTVKAFKGNEIYSTTPIQQTQLGVDKVVDKLVQAGSYQSQTETGGQFANQATNRMNYLSPFTVQHKANLTDTYPNNAIKLDTTTLKNLVQNDSIKSTATSEKSTNSSKKEKKLKDKAVKNKIQQSWLSYGLTAGTSMGHTPNQFFGAEASIKIYNRIRINPGLFFHQNRKVSGNIIHPSYFKPDSIAPFSISDVRKIDVLSIPLQIEVKATNSLSVKGGLVFNILQKQYGAITKINSLPDKRDTLNQSVFVNKSLQQTQFTHANLGLNLGVGYQYKGFNISANYVSNFKNYEVTSPLGNYSTRFQAVQFGVGYQFNLVKKEKKK